MEQPNLIPIEDADLPTLKAYAELSLGLEIKDGTNGKHVRAKILAASPTLTHVPALAPVEPPAAVQASEEPEPIVAAPTPAPAAAVAEIGHNSQRPKYSLNKPHLDPKVRMRFHKTADKVRAREVTISNNGFVCRYQRGQVVDVPYRIYLAAEDAKEMASIETDEINPVTNDPIMGWEPVYSYPFEVISMPSAEEIAAWHEATRDGFADRAPVNKAA